MSEVGKSVTVQTGGLNFDVRVNYSIQPELVKEDLKPEYEDEAPIEASDGKRWLITDVRFRERGGDEQPTLGPSQWTMIDRRQEVSPVNEAMRKGVDTLPTEATLEPLSSTNYRVIFETRFETAFVFVMEALSSNYRTIRWESSL